MPLLPSAPEIWWRAVLTLTLATIFVSSGDAGVQEVLKNMDRNGDLGRDSDVIPVGDPRRCVETAKKSGTALGRFEVLPGYGWDNLRNLDQGQVYTYSYSQCRTTDDGQFLLPDSVSAVPVKSSRVDTFAEMVEHYKAWTSVDSRSINVDGGGLVEDVMLSGKFAADFQDVKSKQIGDKSVTMRTQARYVRYAVQLQPDSALHPSFTFRLLEIAAMHQMNETQQARYLAQLLVRDFGTHVVTKAKAGAALVKVDQVNQAWVTQNSEKKSDILVSASVSFLSLFNISMSYEQKHDETFTSQYLTQQTSSTAEALGGPVFLPGGYNASEWVKQVDSNLVAVDRSGDPLYFVVTQSALPNLQPSTVSQVAESVREAVHAYYAHNKLPGCMDMQSSNFAAAANVDDGSCQGAVTNLTFGGVFQSCVLEQGSDNGNLCKNMTQENPATGDLSCPPNYQAVHLNRGTTRSSSVTHHCYWILFIEICSDRHYSSVATYDTYWCAATGQEPPDSGYLFGGVFTTHVDNPVTKSQSCPPSYYALKMAAGGDLKVCVSDDFEFGSQSAVPFAGFLSCEAGNPLAVPGNSSQYSKSKTSLQSFFVEQAQAWPQKCPTGYSKHLAIIDQGCEINYCVKTGSLGNPTIPPVKRPPFMRQPSLPPPVKENLIFYDTASNTWLKNAEAHKAASNATATKFDNSQPVPNYAPSASPLPTAAVVAISVVSTLVVVGLLIGIRRLHQRRRMAMFRPLDSRATDTLTGYGSGGVTVTSPDSVN